MILENNHLSISVQIVTLTKIEQVRRAILLQILSGKLVPGQRLLEAKLASELNVSQATVNAALQDLHNQSLVTKSLNRSTTVCRYTQAEIENLFKVRMALEPVAAEAAALVWTEGSDHRLIEQVDEMRQAARSGDLIRFYLADYTFHQEIYRLSANPFLIQACQAIAAAPFAYIFCDQLKALPADYLGLAEDHQDIIRAIRQGPSEALSVSQKRIAEWLQYSLRALQALSRH